MISKETSAETLENLSHPNRGRIVAVGKSPDGQSFRLLAGMGGRSAGSKNRYYQQVADLNGNPDYIRTAVHDLSGQTGDASATLYVAQRSWRGWHVASNGEQTEGIAVAMAMTGSYGFKSGQELYNNEGEQNAYTSRITVACSEDRPRIAYMGKIVSILETPEDSTYDVFLLGAYDHPLGKSEAYMTTTYDGHGGTDANREQPWGFLLHDYLEEDMDALWEAWDPNTRANLVGKQVSLYTGEVTYSFRSIHEGRA